jgi:very-short-patch-repair endonuclease
VEVDGSQHCKEKDSERDRWFEGQGPFNVGYEKECISQNYFGCFYV